MAYSKVGISNLALGYVGCSQTIAALDEDSQEARACNTYFDQVRDELLRAYEWSFATRYATLAQVTEFEEDEDPEINDWGYAFRVPNDCLRVLRILTPNGDAEPNPYPFDLGGDDSGLLLYCDLDDVEIKYISRIENPARYAPDFAKALAWALAAEICFPLSIQENLRTRALDQARTWAGKAASTAMQERQARPAPDSQFIRARD